MICCTILPAFAPINRVRADDEQTAYGTTVMEYSDGRFFVMGHVEGSRVGRFLIDLGASNTIIARSALSSSVDMQELDDERLPEIMGLQGKITDIKARVNLGYFKTGTIRIKNITALVVDSLMKMGDRDVSGILGLDILGRAPCLKILMSPGRKPKYELQMYACDEIDADSTNYDSLMIQNDYIIISGAINGRPLSFILDTGIKNSLITPEAARESHVILDSNFIMVYQGLDRLSDTAVAGHVSYALLGNTRVDRVGLFVGKMPIVQGESFRTEGIIGNDILTRFRQLEIDFTRKRFRLIP